VTASAFARADDSHASSDGYKFVPVNLGGKTVLVRVRDSQDPLRNVSSSPDGKYDPERIFSTTSVMADKKFALPSDGLAKADPEFKGRGSFVTKAYTDTALAPALPNLTSKSNLPTSTSAYSRSATGLDKSYLTASADAGQDRTAALGNQTSPDQGRAANIGDKTVSTYADPFADKKFEGPEADAVHRHLTKLSNGQMYVTDLPDRPLTIDEVRNLINHGFKPDTDKPPEEQSKPLNDPDYQPEPLREMPTAPEVPPVSDDDKNDPVPPPGTMAQPPPENNVPLPQP
jgi:hypothetical protein